MYFAVKTLLVEFDLVLYSLTVSSRSGTSSPLASVSCDNKDELFWGIENRNFCDFYVRVTDRERKDVFVVQLKWGPELVARHGPYRTKSKLTNRRLLARTLELIMHLLAFLFFWCFVSILYDLYMHHFTLLNSSYAYLCIDHPLGTFDHLIRFGNPCFHILLSRKEAVSACFPSSLNPRE